MKKGPAEEVRTGEEDFFVNPYAKIDEVIEKRRRNLEKRKIRLLQYQEEERNGKQLTDEQLQALSRIGEVETQIEFVKDISKTLTSLHKDFNRAKKQREEANKREQMERERKFLADFVNYQGLLRSMGKPHVRKAFTEGSDGAAALDGNDWSVIDFLSDCFNPSIEKFSSSADFERKCEETAAQSYAVIYGTKEKLFEKRSGASMKDLLEKVTSCQYVQEMVANQVSTEEEVEEAKSEEEEDAVQKADPKVVFVQGEGEISKGTSEVDAAQGTPAEFGYEYAVQGEAHATESAPLLNASPKPENRVVATGDGGEGGAENGTLSTWAPAEGKSEANVKPGDAQENAFAVGSVPANRPDRRPRGSRGGRFRDTLPRDGNERRRVPKDGRQQRDPREYRDRGPRENFENAPYGGQGRSAGRGGKGPGGRGGYGPRGGGGYRSQNSHMNDLTNGYGNGGNYGSRNAYNDANQPRRIGINFASDSNVGSDSRK